MNEPNFLTRMKLSECWGDSLNAEELKELNDYIEKIKQENQQLKDKVNLLELANKNTYETSQDMLGELQGELQKTKEQLTEEKKIKIKNWKPTPDDLLDLLNQELVNQNRQKDSIIDSLKTRIKTIKRRRKLQSQKIRKYKEIITNQSNALKNKNEVIEECIESIQNFMTHIDDGFCADMMTFIDILNKYKGDKNGN